MSAIRRELRAIDPTVAIEHIKTLEQIRADSIAPQTFAMRLLVASSLAGSILALIGIYGVLSLSVGARRREIAIRTAVGARRGDIMSLVLGQGFRLIGMGLILGMGMAVALARVLRTLLFRVEPNDPITLIGVTVMFATVGLLACWIPARRATRVDPMVALRYE
jgi:putative ABC transport system permease protein